MTLKVIHQTGHNFNWNLDAIEEDNCGDSLIFSPVHQSPKQIAKVSDALRSESLFDPQFYLPSSQKPRFKEYEFFPETLAGGFSTTTFEAQAAIAADRCIKYQVAAGFRKIVVPTRFLPDLYTDYIERQKVFSVNAFIDASEGKRLCLNLALTPAMIEDKGFRQKLLNWVTSYPEVDELYLIYSYPRDTKQILDAKFLLACLSFSREIQDTGLRLTLGYLNSESLIFSLLGDVALTVGTFENTRMFSLDKFLVNDEERRGPRARIYLPGLLNWIQFDQAKDCAKKAPSIWKNIHRDSRHSEAAFKMAVEPAFNQPQLYRHHFICIQEQFDALKPLAPKDRKALMLEWLELARSSYGQLTRLGVEFEKHGRGSHIDAWIDVLKNAAV